LTRCMAMLGPPDGDGKGSVHEDTGIQQGC
jgi:hypothetical protein